MAIKIKKISSFKDIDNNMKTYIENNFFLDDNWLKIVSEVFKLENIYLEVKYSNKYLYFFGHKRENLIFAPFIGYGGIINPSSLNNDEILEIFQTIEAYTGCKIKRVKIFPDVKPVMKLSEKNMHNTAILEILNDQLEQEKKYKKVVRNSINYAKRNGVEIKTIDSGQIRDFYSIYAATMERVKSDYITPEVLFEKMRSLENVIFLGAYINNKLIAGSVFMFSSDLMFYWWNSSNKDGRDLCANYLLIDNAIKLARVKGVKYLDMASSNNAKIERGKLLWGSRRVPFPYFEFN